MSLRDLVTGSDACTADNGAGPSNAFASLANSLLGTSTKEQERLREIPGLQGLPGTSGARFAPQRPEDAALAAVEGEQMAVPGLFRGQGRDVDEFLQQTGSSRSAATDVPWHAEFNATNRPERQFVRPEPPSGAQQAGPLAPSFQAFVNSAKAQYDFRPLPSPQLNLSMEDQCRIRDRSTIMARHIFMEGGDAFADEQVRRLLQSLHIDPRALPGGPRGANWEHIYQNGRGGLSSTSLHDAIGFDQQRHAKRPDVDRWADQFANLDLTGNLDSDALAQEFFKEMGPGASDAWAQEFAEASPAEAWADDFSQAQLSAAARESQAGNAAAAMEQARGLKETLAASTDPKFRNSKFLQFISKMSRGEIILEDDQAKEVGRPGTANGWAQDFAQDQAHNDHEAAWNSVTQKGRDREAWADEFDREVHPPNEWADQFATERVAENWAHDFSERQATGTGVDSDYIMSPNNPFLTDLESFAKGKELFRNGLLSEAVLALEAEVQRQPNNVEAWRLLGTVHAENDDDQQAIAALGKALQAAPQNPEVLLSLGVSHTNELDQSRALTYLMEWLKTQPGQAGAALIQLPKDSRERLRVVVDIFRTAAHMNSGLADAHVALGVLYNLSRNYDGAVGAFKTALQSRSSDYSLWNKLGATLANSGRSGEAISAYQKALDLKPNYMRAWTNMGISQANIGEYEASARYYIRALGLNPSAGNVWSYLKTSLTCAGRNELLQAAEEGNLTDLAAALPL